MVGVRRPDVRARSSSRTDAVAVEILVSELNSMVQRLGNELEAERSRSKYDGRAVIEAGKKRRRELISQVARHGLNSL